MRNECPHCKQRYDIGDNVVVAAAHEVKAKRQFTNAAYKAKQDATIARRRAKFGQGQEA